ncbi:MAG: glutamine amidotransferase family protein [Anaerolineae bacterium]
MAWSHLENRYNDDRVSSACGLFGFIDTTGQMHDGQAAIEALDSMKERGNGLGSGYAVYGCYPDLAEAYALHVMCRTDQDRQEMEAYLRPHFTIVHDEPIPHWPVPGIDDAPIVWRFFCAPKLPEDGSFTADEWVVHHVMYANTHLEGAYIYSSGKNLGIFKGVGHPLQIAEFYGVADYAGYMWTAHNRFPTNTPGWWGGAHPFGLLDWSVVHNGEISSYGTNRRYLEMKGYHCTMQTDTEVMAYASDLLMRRHHLTPKMAALVMASPLWNEIEVLSEKEQQVCRAVRQTYGSLLMNGPFTIIIGRTGELIGLGDRIRLRPLVAATAGPILYVSSEIAPVHLVETQVDAVWTPYGGEPVVGRLGEPPIAPRTASRNVTYAVKEPIYG